ncbi:MAG: acylphosphatase [Candidatus Omnitrophota bacterium]|jgi:acylphosphatase
MKKRAHIYYSGNVQGIGFRFTVIRLAEKLDVAGWVNNLGDARVELVAEANEGALQDFLSQISNIFSRYIQNIDVSWEPATGEFKDFGVRF